MNNIKFNLVSIFMSVFVLSITFTDLRAEATKEVQQEVKKIDKNEELEKEILTNENVKFWDQILTRILEDETIAPKLPIKKTIEEWIIYLNNTDFWNKETKSYVLAIVKTHFKTIPLSRIKNNHVSKETIDSILNTNFDSKEGEIDTNEHTLKTVLTKRLIDIVNNDSTINSLKDENKTQIQTDSDKNLSKDSKMSKCSICNKKYLILLGIAIVLLLIFFGRKLM